MTLDLFGEPTMPGGFRYRPDIIDWAEESSLLDRLAGLPFKEFEFHGFLGKRRVVSFGWKYDFSTERMHPVDPIPEFVLPVRERAAAALDRQAADFEQLLVTEYGPAAGIGWHKDKATFANIERIDTPDAPMSSAFLLAAPAPFGSAGKRRSNGSASLWRLRRDQPIY